MNCEPSKSNSYDGFVQFALKHNIVLSPTQQEIARQLLSWPVASGKSTLITLLFKYDESNQNYLDYFGKARTIGGRAITDRFPLPSQSNAAEIRANLVSQLLSRMIPTERVIELATPLSEWILTGSHALPCSTDDTESTNSAESSAGLLGPLHGSQCAA